MITRTVFSLCLFFSFTEAFASAEVCQAARKGTRKVENVFTYVREPAREYLYLLGRGNQGSTLYYVSASGDERTYESAKFKIVVNFAAKELDLTNKLHAPNAPESYEALQCEDIGE